MTLMTDREIRIPGQRPKPHGRNAAENGHARDPQVIDTLIRNRDKAALRVELASMDLSGHQLSAVQLRQISDIFAEPAADIELIDFPDPEPNWEQVMRETKEQEEQDRYSEEIDEPYYEDPSESDRLFLEPQDLGMADVRQLRRRSSFLDCTDDEKGDCPWFGFHVMRRLA